MQNLTFQTHGQPGKSGVYMVDRGEKQGKAFRYFSAESGKWSITCYDPQEALALAGTDTALPFLAFHPNPVKVQAPKSEVVKMLQAQTAIKATKSVQAPKAPKVLSLIHI